MSSVSRSNLQGASRRLTNGNSLLQISPSIASSASAHIIPRAPASAGSRARTICSFVVPRQAFGSRILLRVPVKANPRSEATLAATLPVYSARTHSTVPSTEASQAILAIVERTASFQHWFVHRPQRARLRPSSAAASSAEASPLGPFPRCIPGS